MVTKSGGIEGDPEGNQVHLSGRLGGDPVVRTLPSGDELVTFRLIVSRAPTAMTRNSRQRVDWVGCSVWGARVRRTVRAWESDDIVAVDGALRRRYYRGESAGSSVVEVEVLGARRIARADKRESRRAEIERPPPV